MKLIRSFAIAAAAGLALAAFAGAARAGDCKSCGGGGFGGHFASTPGTLFGGVGLFKQPKLPAFQAAPWYLYWPYDAHFLTPAPVSGAFYGPPLPGNFPVNPYFPGPAIPVAPVMPGPAPGIPPAPPGR